MADSPPIGAQMGWARTGFPPSFSHWSESEKTAGIRLLAAFHTLAVLTKPPARAYVVDTQQSQKNTGNHGGGVFARCGKALERCKWQRNAPCAREKRRADRKK